MVRFEDLHKFVVVEVAAGYIFPDPTHEVIKCTAID